MDHLFHLQHSKHQNYPPVFRRLIRSELLTSEIPNQLSKKNRRSVKISIRHWTRSIIFHTNRTVQFSDKIDGRHINNIGPIRQQPPLRDTLSIVPPMWICPQHSSIGRGFPNPVLQPGIKLGKLACLKSGY